jgi:hypothetical protein
MHGCFEDRMGDENCGLVTKFLANPGTKTTLSADHFVQVCTTSTVG